MDSEGEQAVDTTNHEVQLGPPEAPDWVTTKLVELTKRVWQPYYAEALTNEDAIAMIVGVGCLIDRLAGEPP